MVGVCVNGKTGVSFSTRYVLSFSAQFSSLSREDSSLLVVTFGVSKSDCIVGGRDGSSTGGAALAKLS